MPNPISQGFVFQGIRQCDVFDELDLRKKDGDRYKEGYFSFGSVFGPTKCGHKIWFAKIGNEDILATNFTHGHYFINFIENNTYLIEYCIGDDAIAWGNELNQAGPRGDESRSVILRHTKPGEDTVVKQTYFGKVKLESDFASVKPNDFHLPVPRRGIQIVSRRWKVVSTKETFGC